MIKENFVDDFSTFKNKLNEKLNDSKEELLQKRIETLKRRHWRSSSTETFIKKVQSLLRGEIEKVPRNFFSLTRGQSWGLEFVDQLVQDEILRMEKIGRTQFLYSITSPVVHGNILDEKINRFYQELKNDLAFHGIGWSNLEVTFKDRTFKFSNSGYVGTYLHWEKGHGVTRTMEEQEQDKQNIIDKVENSRYLNDLLNKLDQNEIEYDVVRKSEFDSKDIRTFHGDGHRGYLMTYKVDVKIK
jgi:hypothetical protein